MCRGAAGPTSALLYPHVIGTCSAEAYGVRRPPGTPVSFLHPSKGHNSLPRLALRSIKAAEYMALPCKHFFGGLAARGPSLVWQRIPCLEVIKLSLCLLRRGNLACHAATRHIGRPAHMSHHHVGKPSRTSLPCPACHKPQERTSGNTTACELPEHMLHGSVQGHSITASEQCVRLYAWGHPECGPGVAQQAPVNLGEEGVRLDLLRACPAAQPLLRVAHQQLRNNVLHRAACPSGLQTSPGLKCEAHCWIAGPQ